MITENGASNKTRREPNEKTRREPNQRGPRIPTNETSHSPDPDLALVHLREVLIKHRRLGMANVQVAAGFGRETRDDLAHLRALEPKGEGCGGLVGAGLSGFRLYVLWHINKRCVMGVR